MPAKITETEFGTEQKYPQLVFLLSSQSTTTQLSRGSTLKQERSTAFELFELARGFTAERLTTFRGIGGIFLQPSIPYQRADKNQICLSARSVDPAKVHTNAQIIAVLLQYRRFFFHEINTCFNE